MKHIFNIIYNVFKFHWCYMGAVVASFALSGAILSVITKDISWIFIQTGASFAGTFAAAYMMENRRYKEKGHY